MSELVKLEGTADAARREEVMAQLEALWPKAATTPSSSPSAAATS